MTRVPRWTDARGSRTRRPGRSGTRGRSGVVVVRKVVVVRASDDVGDVARTTADGTGRYEVDLQRITVIDHYIDDITPTTNEIRLQTSHRSFKVDGHV